MKRLRILQIFARYLHYGGEEGIVARFEDVLRECHKVEYFTEATEDILARGLAGRVLLPFLAFRNPGAIRRLRAAQERGGFDFWQIHNVFPAISPDAYSLAFKLGIPVIHYLHNYKFGCANGFMFVNGRENRDCIKGDFRPAIRQRSWHGSYVKTAVMAAVLAHTRRMGVFDKVTRWIAISHAQKAIHLEMGIPADKIDVIHHFLKVSPEDAAFPIPADGYALFIGRLSPEKGVGRLLEAWRRLPKHRKLVIVGDGPSLDALKRQAHEQGLDNVEFLGFVPREGHAAIWAGSAFSVVPSIWQEPFGMVVLEAWAQGRPVVAHRIGALPEIVRHEETGFLASPDDPGDLASALERAFSSGRENLAEMGRAGQLELSGHYSKDRWLEEINATYRRAGLG